MTLTQIDLATARRVWDGFIRKNRRPAVSCQIPPRFKLSEIVLKYDLTKIAKQPLQAFSTIYRVKTAAMPLVIKTVRVYIDPFTGTPIPRGCSSSFACVEHTCLFSSVGSCYHSVVHKQQAQQHEATLNCTLIFSGTNSKKSPFSAICGFLLPAQASCGLQSNYLFDNA